MDITIYRSQTESLIKKKSLQELVHQLPASLQLKALRYKSELSAYNYVIGRLLLKHGLGSFELDNDLERIEFQQNGKPVLPEIHFNISHSDHQVICGFSKEGLLGVDLEKISPIDFDDFTSMFSAQEWTAIRGANDPIRTFYWFWTRKESIIKALGRTLSYLHQIELDVSSDHFMVDGKRYFLRQIDIEEGFVGAVCTEEKIEALEFIQIRF
ncbi:MAG: 4'-phosphopantetheinyl transferase [Roseivirga sp.]|jgi:4'-phosphopantetheinyl transferase